MSESNLLDKLEFGMFGQRRNGLGNSEHGADDVVRGIPQVPGKLLGQAAHVDTERVASVP